MRGDPLGLPLGSFAAAASGSYTPTVTWTSSTVTGAAGYFTKLPGALLVWVTFTVSAAGGANALTISLPAGYTAAFSTINVGELVHGAAGALVFDRLGVASGGAVLTYQAADFPTPAAAAYSGFFVVPITT